LKVAAQSIRRVQSTDENLAPRRDVVYGKAMTLDKRFRSFVHPIFISSLLAAQACAAAPPPNAIPQTPTTTAGPAVTPTHAAPNALPPAPAKEAHPDTHPLAADIAALRRTFETHISPDGSRVAYLLGITSFDPKAKPSDNDFMGGWKVERQLFVVDRAGGQPRQLTRHENPIFTFRWSPDGRAMAFLRKQGNAIKLHVLPVDGGEAEIIDLGKLEPQQLEWSTHGDMIAFTAEEPRNDAQKESDFRNGGVVSEATAYRSSILYVVPRAGGQPRRITPGPENITSFVWAPDDKRFFVTTSRNGDPYEVEAELSARIISATDGALLADLEPKPRTLNSIRWSPDGSKVSYLRGDDTLSLLNTLVVYDIASKTPSKITNGPDLTIHGYTWSADSKRLFLTIDERTYTKIVQIPAAGGAPKDLGRTNRIVFGEIGSPDTSGRFLSVISATTTDSGVPSILEIEKASARPVAQTNPQVLGWKLSKPEIVKWKNNEGTDLEGLFVPTSHVPTGQPSPLVVMPHGGPDAASQESFSAWGQYFAARGYSVFMPNYRGSTAYGHAFYAANRGRLGEIEFKDIESGVDSLIAAGKVDASRLYYGGWSWGGYLTAWTIGSTKRYRAAMVGAGVTEVVGQYVLSDINHGQSSLWEFKGNPWKNLDTFDKSNPMRLMSHVVTPTLVAHGDNDARVPAFQGLLVYRALSDLGIEVKLLKYPREPHGLREPAHMAHLLANWAAWFDAH
jgi:dipeptidyl aminopeptidase/acylaminoacyl peptidase